MALAQTHKAQRHNTKPLHSPDGAAARERLLLRNMPAEGSTAAASAQPGVRLCAALLHTARQHELLLLLLLMQLLAPLLLLFCCKQTQLLQQRSTWWLAPP